MIAVDPDGEAEFLVFRPEATKNSRAWTAIQNYTNRKGSPDHMTIYNGPAATGARFETAIRTPGAHVIDTGGHTVDMAVEQRAVGVNFNDNRGLRDPNFKTLPDDKGQPGGQLLPVGSAQVADVAIFGCNRPNSRRNTQPLRSPARSLPRTQSLKTLGGAT